MAAILSVVSSRLRSADTDNGGDYDCKCDEDTSHRVRLQIRGMEKSD